MLNTNKLCDISFIYHPADLRFVRRIDARMTAKDVDCQVSEAELGKTDEGKTKLKADILRSHLVAIVLSPQSAASQTCGELIQYAVSSGKRLVTLIVDENIEVDVHPAIAENPYIFFRQQDVLEDGIQKLLELAVANQHIRLHTELLVYASRWHQNKRADSLLLPPTRVDQARQWLADGANRLPKPSPLQVEYIHASRRQKPAAKRNLSVYQMLAVAVLIGIAVVIGLLQNAVASRPTATETAVTITAASAGTQAAPATAETASAAVLADIAASVADSLTQTSHVNPPADAAPSITPQTEAAQPDAPSLILAAEQALETGAADLALTLALAASESPDDPDHAHRILRRAAALSPVLTLNDVSSLRFHPTRDEFAVIPRASDRALVYDLAARAVKRELTDHEAALVILEYSRDGQFLITAAQDGELVIRSGASGALLHRRRRHQDSVTATAMYPDGKRMVTAGGNPLLAVWDLTTGEELASYSAAESDAPSPNDLLVTADGSRIIAWSNLDGKPVMTQWSADTLDLLTADAGEPVYRGYDSDGQIAWSGGRALPAYAGDPNAGDVIFWDLTAAQPQTRLTDGFNWSLLAGGDIAAATDSLLFIAFQDDSALLGVRSSAGEQRAVWVDVNDGTVRRSYENGIAARIASADFISPQTILSVADDNRLVLWSSEDGRLMREIGSAPRPLQKITVNAAGDAVIGQTNDGAAYLWPLAEDPPSLRQTFPNAVTAAAFSQSGEALLIVSDGAAALQNADDQENIVAFSDSRLARMNPSGTHIVIHTENSIAVHDAASGLEQAAWEIDLDDIHDLALAPTGDYVLAIGADELWLFQPESGEPQPLQTPGQGPARMVRFAPDGSLLMTLHAERAILWETADASPRQAYPLGLTADFPLRQRFHMVFSPAADKLYFFARLDKGLAGLTVFSLNDGAAVRHAFVAVQHGELTPDGEHLLLAFSDHSIQIIDTASGAALSRLIGHQDAIRRLHYQKETNRLLSAGDEGFLLLWDVEAEAIDQQYVHPNAVADFSFSGDGGRILSRDSAGVYRLWDVESLPELIDRIQSAFSLRELTCAERQQYRVPPLCE